jgi:signal transduction histidine kinase
VTYAQVAVEVDVIDDGSPSGPFAERAGTSSEPYASGHGLDGMRERVVVYGGQFSAGRRADGGFRVHAHFPLPAAADPDTSATALSLVEEPPS